MRMIWVVGLVLLATTIFLSVSCSNREPEGVAETSILDGHIEDASIAVDETESSNDSYYFIIINVPESSKSEEIPVYTPPSEPEVILKHAYEDKADSEEKGPSRFSFGASAGYGFMYVNADYVKNVPSDWGYNIGIKGLYKLNSYLSVGLGVNFGQYHYDSSGYPGAYTVIDPVLIAEAGFSLSEKLSLNIGLNAGVDIRMYEEQKGVYPTVMANLEVGYKVSNRITVGLGATGGMTFQNYELDSKITAGGVLRVSF